MKKEKETETIMGGGCPEYQKEKLIGVVDNLNNERVAELREEDLK